MSNLPSGFALLLFLASAEPERERSLEPTQEEIETFKLPNPGAPPAGEPTPHERPALFRISGVAMFASSAADFATTELGLSRGLQEGNPVASQRGARLLHHVAGPAAVYWATERLQKSGSTKLALGLRIALMAAYSYATLHNLRQVNSLPYSP
jgi:hypothetical protein